VARLPLGRGEVDLDDVQAFTQGAERILAIQTESVSNVSSKHSLLKLFVRFLSIASFDLTPYRMLKLLSPYYG
jgi:hypothetical protein